jgi:hypothetical protein
MSNIESAITAASSDNPSEFKDHIQNALMNKLSIALDLKKIEVGSQYFNDEYSTVDEPEETLEISNED